MNARTPVSAYKLLSSPCNKSIVFVSSRESLCSTIQSGQGSCCSFQLESCLKVFRVGGHVGGFMFGWLLRLELSLPQPQLKLKLRQCLSTNLRNLVNPVSKCPNSRGKGHQNPLLICHLS